MKVKDTAGSAYPDHTYYAPLDSQWLDLVDRGGIFRLNDTAFEFFVALEKKISPDLARHIQSASTAKGDLTIKAAEDPYIRSAWESVVFLSSLDEQYSAERLHETAQMRITT